MLFFHAKSKWVQEWWFDSGHLLSFMADMWTGLELNLGFPTIKSCLLFYCLFERCKIYSLQDILCVLLGILSRLLFLFVWFRERRSLLYSRSIKLPYQSGKVPFSCYCWKRKALKGILFLLAMCWCRLQFLKLVQKVKIMISDLWYIC